MPVKTWIRVALFCLVVEKIIQHGLTALFFVTEVEGIGVPDIGPWLMISKPVMAVLNVILAVLFLGVIFLFRQEKIVSGLNLVTVLAGVDILAEILFHGFGYITVSLTIAVILIGLSVTWRRTMLPAFRSITSFCSST